MEMTKSSFFNDHSHNQTKLGGAERSSSERFMGEDLTQPNDSSLLEQYHAQKKIPRS